MAGFSDYLENKILNHIFGITPFSAPSIYVALFTSAPSDAGGGTEVSGLGYARKAYSSWNAAVNGATSNSGTISFNQATGPWGTITHFALFDAPTGGNMLGWGVLSNQKTIDNLDTVEFASGALSVTLD